MLRLFLLFFMTCTSFMNPLAASEGGCWKCCKSTITPEDPGTMGTIEPMLQLTSDTLRVLRVLLTQLERSSLTEIPETEVIAALDTVDANLKKLKSFPSIVPLQKTLAHNAKHHFGRTAGTCSVKYHGFDCAECGRGERGSWGYRVYHSARDPWIFCCNMSFGTLWCAGAPQCYLAQWLCSPCLPESYECKRTPATIVKADLRLWIDGRVHYLEQLENSLQQAAPLTGAPMPSAPPRSEVGEDLESASAASVASGYTGDPSGRHS